MGDESNPWGEVFARGVGFLIGEGRRVHFWSDDWVGVGPLSMRYRRVFREVSNKESSVNDCFVWRGDRVS